MNTSRRASQTTALPFSRVLLLDDLKDRVPAAQVRAILSFNRGNENGAG